MLGALTNTINAVLVFLVAAVPLLPQDREPSRRLRPFWVRSVLGMGIAVALAESGKHFVVWPGRPSFPSGHETLALAAGTCLATWDRRWLALAAPLAAVQGWALVAGQFHEPVDIAGAVVSGILPPLLCQAIKRPHTR